MFCKYCGNELADNTVICPFCEGVCNTSVEVDRPCPAKNKGGHRIVWLTVSLSVILVIALAVTAVMTDLFGILDRDGREDTDTADTETAESLTPTHNSEPNTEKPPFEVIYT